MLSSQAGLLRAPQSGSSKPRWASTTTSAQPAYGSSVMFPTVSQPAVRLVVLMADEVSRALPFGTLSGTVVRAPTALRRGSAHRSACPEGQGVAGQRDLHVRAPVRRHELVAPTAARAPQVGRKDPSLKDIICPGREPVGKPRRPAGVGLLCADGHQP